jgi:flavin reductase (DIM6/NTAB) family NADH-FMN oxidoreductase RutF/effector-binding domain-containing protein
MSMTKVGAFIPMPVAPTVLVGAMVGGKPNYATVGFASGANIKPPILCVSLNHSHCTVKGIRETGVFSVNVPSVAQMRECDYCGLVSGRSVDKSSIFTTFFGELREAPMIEECPIACECRLVGSPVDFAMDIVFFGEVVASYVDAALYKKGAAPDILAIDPLLAGLDRRYRRVGEAAGKTFSIGWEYASAADGGKDEGPRCELVSHGPRHVLAARIDTIDGLGLGAVGETLGRIAEYAKKQGKKPVGGAFVSREEGMETEAGMRAGFVFDASLRGQGSIESAKIPGGRFAECLHLGPYDLADRAVDSLRAFIGRTGFTAAGPLYSFYLNDPALTAPDNLETLLAIPVKRGRR